MALGAVPCTAYSSQHGVQQAPTSRRRWRVSCAARGRPGGPEGSPPGFPAILTLDGIFHQGIQMSLAETALTISSEIATGPTGRYVPIRTSPIFPAGPQAPWEFFEADRRNVSKAAIETDRRTVRQLRDGLSRDAPVSGTTCISSIRGTGGTVRQVLSNDGDRRMRIGHGRRSVEHRR
jgi:hypothetical protein